MTTTYGLHREFVLAAIDLTGYLGEEAAGVAWEQGPTLLWDGDTDADPSHVIRYASWEELFADLAAQLRYALADEQAEEVISKARSKGVPIS